MTRRIVFAVVFLSFAWTSVPRLVKLARQAAYLRNFSIEERRLRVIGPYYESVARLRSSLPDEPVALVLRNAEDISAALFFNYYTYPRRTVIFKSLAAYRAAKERPGRLVRVTDDLQEMTYGQIRDEGIGKGLVAKVNLPTDTMQRAIVPFVGSVDGPPPDVYTTEAAIENTSNARVRVRFELFPWKRTAEVVLEPRQRLTWNDFIYQVFDLREQGWLRFTADAPVRARFWFVNRGRRDAVELPFARVVQRHEFDAPPGSKLWIINPNDAPLILSINGAGHIVKPMEWAWHPVSGRLAVDGQSPFVAFVSSRDDNKRSHFEW